MKPDEIGAAIAANLRAERARAGIDQKDLAARMGALGYNWFRQTVGKAEKAERRIMAEELPALAMCLNTTVPRLLDGLI